MAQEPSLIVVSVTALTAAQQVVQSQFSHGASQQCAHGLRVWPGSQSLGTSESDVERFMIDQVHTQTHITQCRTYTKNIIHYLENKN